MLVYISAIIILTAFLLYQYFTFIRIYYIGQSLHKFRELRNEVTLFLSANVQKHLTVKEATEYLGFLVALDGIIKNFDLLKPTITKFNSIKSAYSQILFSTEKLATQSSKAAILSPYKHKVSESILTAFKAIPFFKMRLVIFLLRVLATLSFSLGKTKFSKQLKIVEKLYQLQKEGVPCNS